jgi:sigma-B regulation protein RsbU (phosphoserine phosphatase)
MATDVQAGLYVTMLYAIIDPAQGRVTLARAGHELPLFARRDPERNSVETRFVSSEGMAVGMVPDDLFTLTLTEVTEPFLPGDVLVLFTDGINEAPNEEGKEFSTARLADTVRSLHGSAPREINDGILEAVQRFTGETPQRDDFTLVTVKRV